MRTLINGLIVLTSALALSGCLSSAKLPRQSNYVLKTLPSSVPQTRTRPVTIMVAVPDSTPVYNTTQMAYSTCPYQVNYYVNNRWADTPAQMLQPLMVKTLMQTHHFHAVVTPPFIGRYDYLLNTEVLQLQQNFTQCPAVLQFVIRAQMVRMSTGQVTATREFTAYEPMPERSPYGGAIAANRALSQILYELAEFSIRAAK